MRTTSDEQWANLWRGIEDLVDAYGERLVFIGGVAVFLHVGNAQAAPGFIESEQVSFGIDGGEETYRRIRDPKSLLLATVAIPFEDMGKAAAEAVERIVVKGGKREDVTSGPYLYVDAQLIDGTNVPPTP